MDLNPKHQAYWRFLSLTVYNIHIESTRANPDLRRLVVLINTLNANIGRSAGSRSPDNNLEVTTLECKGQDHKRISTDHDDIHKDTMCGESDDFDGHRGILEAESLNAANDPSQSDSDTGQAYRWPKHRHTGDNTTWQAYKVPACFALPSIAEDDEENRSNGYGPVEAIDVGQATGKHYYWSKEKATCCCVSVDDVSEGGELYF